MKRSRGRLVAGAVASVVLYLLSVGHAVASASDPPSRTVRAPRGSPAQVKTPKAYWRLTSRHLASPEGILLQDPKSGRILLEHHADQPMAPASPAKLLPAIGALPPRNLGD